MKRITIHLSGVKKKLVETKKFNKDTNSFDYTSKKVLFNTIAFECENEEEGLGYMSQYLANNEGVKATKHYFCNIY